MTTLVRTPRSNARHKVTIRLSPDATLTAQEAVELGSAPKQDSFIKDAIRLRAREVRHARMRIQAAAAMSDRDFVEDMRDTMRAFESADRDGWLPRESFALFYQVRSLDKSRLGRRHGEIADSALQGQILRTIADCFDID